MSVHMNFPQLIQAKGEVMKVGRDPTYDLMLSPIIFTGSADEDLQSFTSPVSVAEDREQCGVGG